MVIQFSLIPLGRKGTSVSRVLAKAFQPIVNSGLPYKTGPMGTSVEGEWDEVMDLIDTCRKTLHKYSDRVYITISVDDRAGAKNRLTGKVDSLEKKLGQKISR